MNVAKANKKPKKGQTEIEQEIVEAWIKVKETKSSVEGRLWRGERERERERERDRKRSEARAGGGGGGGGAGRMKRQKAESTAGKYEAK